MPDYRTYWVAGGTYFFTVNLLERYRDLHVRQIGLLRAVVRGDAVETAVSIDAWVSCPTICIACRPAAGGRRFLQPLEAIKNGFAKALPQNERRSKVRMAQGERAIWQRRFWEHVIRDDRHYTT